VPVRRMTGVVGDVSLTNWANSEPSMTGI
jgi:hypothetical protein